MALCTEEALSDLRTSLPGNFNETGGRISQTKQVEARGGMEREHFGNVSAFQHIS